MADIRTSRLLPIIVLMLSGCSRDSPSHEQARKIVTSCGLIVETVEDTYGFDFYGIEVDVKKIPEAEFLRKKDCVEWQFFFKHLDISDVIIGNGKPNIPDYQGIDFTDGGPIDRNLAQ